MVLADYPTSQTSLVICPIWTPIITAEIGTQLKPVKTAVRMVFSAGVIQGKFPVFGVDYSSDSILLLTTLSMKQCMNIDVRSHKSGESKYRKC
jgi:hypothetical protein